MENNRNIPEVGDKVGDGVTGAPVGEDVIGSLVGDAVIGAAVGEDLEVLFVLEDFPIELFVDLVPTWAEAMERVAKMMAAEENFMEIWIWIEIDVYWGKEWSDDWLCCC